MMGKNVSLFNLVTCSIFLSIMLTGCAGFLAPQEDSPPEIEDFSADFTDAVSYRVAGSRLDLEAMGHYPQQAAGQTAAQTGRTAVTLLVKNQTYYDLDKVPISGQVYPETVRPYLEPSEKVSWDTPEMDAFLSNIQGEDVMAYANNAAWWTSKALSYDLPLSRDISAGKSDTVGAVDALASGKGTCSEYTNLFLAALRAKGIPARFISGLWYDGGAPMGIGSYHAWAEFYLQGHGWLPADPQTGRVGIPDTYIKLYIGMDFAEIGILLADIGAEVTLDRDGANQ